MNFISPILFVMITMACSSNTTTQTGCTTQECLDQLNGMAGNTSMTGNSTGGSVVGTGGNSSGSNVTTNTGGNSEITSTNATGGNSTGGNSTGGNSTTTCVTQTCADVVPDWTTTSKLTKPTACGTASDGCGNLLNCGTCTNDGTSNTDCGQAPTTTATGIDLVSHGLKPVANVCGTRCVQSAPTEGSCSNGTQSWICPSSIPPLGFSGCNSINSANPLAHLWCCNNY
jgi:hypothetical protein